MSDETRLLTDQILNLATGNLTNAHPATRAMAMRIVPLWPTARVCGPARTARIVPGQNAAIHRALHLALPGEVLVVDGGASHYYGPFGDILAATCQKRGVTGLVIDGTVRDRADVEALGFPVFCIGTSPQVTAKNDPGEVDIPVSCGGVVVHPGDWVVGDSDGVVVLPANLVSEIVAMAMTVIVKEDAMRERIAAGETTYEIFNLSQLYGEGKYDKGN